MLDLILANFVLIIMLNLVMIHIYWGHGGCWPGRTRQELIDKVFGEGESFPSIYACYAVAFTLLVVSIMPLLVIEAISFFPKVHYISLASYLVALIFLIRGAGGYLPVLEKKWTQIFIYYNRRIYNPLCIILSFLFFYFAQL